MSAHLFSVKEHTVPCAHIREYPLATADSQEDVLHLAVKQYSPLDNKTPERGDITIIGAHANGFPKELYEPLWDELYQELKAKHIRIRSIWITDVAHQGQSGVLNEQVLGNEPSWHDHPRDLFLMVNHFRSQMTRPIFGIGHSMGGFHLTELAMMHPRLFTSLVLIDPVIQRVPNHAGNFIPGLASAKRRDIWPSRDVAKASFGKSKFYQSWDTRVLDLWIKHGLRDLPTQLHPLVSSSETMPAVSADQTVATITPEANTERQVTLKTTKHQEVLTFMRGNFKTASNPDPTTKPNRLTHPDVDLDSEIVSPWYRPESQELHKRLPHLRPSVLYVFGTESNLSHPVLRAEKMSVTGVGVGGSGGTKEGRVQEVVLQAGHLIPMEKVGETARETCSWISRELEKMREDEATIESMRAAVPRNARSRMPEDFLKIAEEERARALKPNL